jgi:hypothetical protein
VSDLEESLRTAERRLQAAQLAGDVATLAPDPVRVSKAEDLQGHREGGSC